MGPQRTHASKGQDTAFMILSYSVLFKIYKQGNEKEKRRRKWRPPSISLQFQNPRKPSPSLLLTPIFSTPRLWLWLGAGPESEPRSVLPVPACLVSACRSLSSSPASQHSFSAPRSCRRSAAALERLSKAFNRSVPVFRSIFCVLF